VLEGPQADPQPSTTLNKTGDTGELGAATWTKIYDTARRKRIPDGAELGRNIVIG
jgi:hypothetical protein